jgi:glyceraldehyde-3-phosphate dehydrogenase (NADP+)
VSPDIALNPWTGEQVWSQPPSTASDIDTVIGQAHRAYLATRADSGVSRADRLRSAAAAVAEGQDELVELLVRTIGKPIRAAKVEVNRTVDVLRLCAEEIARSTGETIPLDSVQNGQGRWGLTFREPYGVAALVTPFNAPLNLLAQKLAPALACGNTVVVKPSIEGAAVTERFLQAVTPHFPAGAVQVVHGGAEQVQALVADHRVRVVSLTGGVAAGQSVLVAAGIKPVHLELGSNSPNIVLHDADISSAARQIARAAFEASGQQCISAQRIIVADGVADDFTAAFAAEAGALVVGDPSDEKTDLGPVVHSRSAHRIAAMVANAEEHGARIVLDGRAHSADNERLIGPTIIADAPAEAAVLCEEAFGPVAVVTRVADLDQAITVANNVPGLLQASCFTQNLQSAMRAGTEIWAGSVWINEATRFRLDIYPFGGTGTSGLGREGIKYAMEAFSQIKFVGMAP